MPLTWEEAAEGLEDEWAGEEDGIGESLNAVKVWYEVFSVSPLPQFKVVGNSIMTKGVL